MKTKNIDWTPNTKLPVGKGATCQRFDATAGPDRLEIETSAWGEGKLRINDAEIAHVHEKGTQLQAFQDLERVAEAVECEPAIKKREEPDEGPDPPRPRLASSERRTSAAPTRLSPKPANPPLPCVPAFWPMAMATAMLQAGEGLELFGSKDLRLAEGIKVHPDRRPPLATPNELRLDLRTMVLRDYGKPGEIPTLINAPCAGHTAMIADYQDGQSLVQTLLGNGISHVALTDWKSATDDMKDLDIDSYLAEVNVAIDDLGGRINLVGICQGGWLSAMAAARFPDKVNCLVLAGAPIDTGAGNGPIKRMAHETPLSFYEELIMFGGGLMKGQFMLQGWKDMRPAEHYVKDYIDVFEHIDDPAHQAEENTFENWYENPIDLPGRWYLQMIRQIFKENRLAKGEFVGLGRTLCLRNITCPAYLLAGDADDVTPPEQILAASRYIGTPTDRVVQKTVPGGHIGLFMGARTLKQHWPQIAQWIAAQ